MGAGSSPSSPGFIWFALAAGSDNKILWTMLTASGLTDLFDRPMTENLNHFAFLAFLVSLSYFGIRQIKKSNVAGGIAFMFVPFAYFTFAIFYFLFKWAEGRSDQFVDWRDSWAVGLTDFILPVNLSFIVFINVLVYFYARFVKWCGTKAETAGKSKIGFIILSIIFPFIAWIILLIIAPGKKKDLTPNE